LILSIVLLRSGRSLEKSGTEAQKTTREQAVLALAGSRGGLLTAADAAQALAMRIDEADLVLTNMAKQQPDLVSLEVDDHGGIYFRFPHLLAMGDQRVRVEPPRQRVAATPLDVVAEIVDEVRGEKSRRATR
jgi:hypothetical protein